MRRKVVLSLASLALLASFTGCAAGPSLIHRSSVVCGDAGRVSDNDWSRFRSAITPFVYGYVQREQPTFRPVNEPLRNKAAERILSEAGCATPTLTELAETSAVLMLALNDMMSKRGSINAYPPCRVS